MNDERYEQSADMRLLDLQRRALGAAPHVLDTSRHNEADTSGIRIEEAPARELSGTIVVAAIDAVPRMGLIPGALLSIALSVTNEGDTAASDVCVSLPLPLATAYRPNSLAIDGAPQDEATALDLFAQGIVLDRLAAGARRTIVVRLTIEAGLGPLVLSPHVSSDSGAVLGPRALRIMRAPLNVPTVTGTTIERPFYESDDADPMPVAESPRPEPLLSVVQPQELPPPPAPAPRERAAKGAAGDQETGLPVAAAPRAPKATSVRTDRPKAKPKPKAKPAAAPPADVSAVADAPKSQPAPRRIERAAAAATVSALPVPSIAAPAPAAAVSALPVPSIAAPAPAAATVSALPVPSIAAPAPAAATVSALPVPSIAAPAPAAVLRVQAQGGPILSVRVDRKRLATLTRLFAGPSLGMIAHYLVLNALAATDPLGGSGSDPALAAFVADQEKLLSRALIATRLGKPTAPEEVAAALPSFPPAVAAQSGNVRLEAPREGETLLLRAFGETEIVFLGRMLSNDGAAPFLRAAQLFVGLCANDAAIAVPAQRTRIASALGAYASAATAEISRIFLRAKLTRKPALFKETDRAFDDEARNVLDALGASLG